MPKPIASFFFIALGIATSMGHAKPQLSDFASQPQVMRVALSHKGTYLSAFAQVNGRRTMWIDTIGVKTPPFVVQHHDWTFNWYKWVSDTKILAGVAIATTMDGVPVVMRRLVQIDAEKRKAKVLFHREKHIGFEQIQDDVLSWLPNEPNHFLVQRNGREPMVFKAKVGAWRLPPKPVQKSVAGVTDFQADALGNVRVGTGYTPDKRSQLLKLKDSDGVWSDHSELLTTGFAVVALPSDQLDILYVLVANDEGLRVARAYNVRTKTLGEVIASHPHSDVRNIILNDEGNEIVSVTYHNEQVATEHRDPWRQKLQAVLDRALPDTTNVISALSKDRSRAIIASNNSHTPVHYFLYDGETNRVDYLQAAYPALMDNAPGRVHQMSFTASDGLTIPAYLTLPVGVDPESKPNLPVVINPHGGPHARNYLTFDWLAQMLTAQGYAVLQINFRGSTGYGVEFQRMGYRQWGQAMQQDITDGTRWIIENGIADPQKVCIMGGSYGGYAALMGVAKEPDLYRCGISLNGVTDLRMMIREDSRYVGGRFASQFIGHLYADKQMLEANSPIHLTEAIKAPLLLVHGSKDRVVPVSHSRRMHRRLGKHPHSYVELDDGNHRLSTSEHRIEYAQSVAEFLAQHL